MALRLKAAMCASCACAAVTASCHQQAQQRTAPFNVLIVGGGLTGSLTAYLLRQRWPADLPPLRLTLWERASYPAGRFGASFHCSGAMADLGAQVASVVEADDEHKECEDGGGHGISAQAIQFAQTEVRRLGLREAAGLGATEERMMWPGIWKHYHAPGGLELMLRRYLEEAEVDDIRLNTKVEQLVPAEGGMCWAVSGSAAAPAGALGKRTPVVTDDAQAVIVCVPATDALEIKGLSKWVSPEHRRILQDVEYDSRAVLAVCYKRELREAIDACFAMPPEIENDSELKFQSELEMDDECLLALLIRQGSKRAEPDGCMVVAHSRRGYQDSHSVWDCAQMVELINQQLSARSGIPADEWAAQVVGTKMIDWNVSQLLRPMESVVDPVPPVASFVAKCPGGLHLVLAGDYLTQSSYLGCVASALDATDRLIANVKHRS